MLSSPRVWKNGASMVLWFTHKMCVISFVSICHADCVFRSHQMRGIYNYQLRTVLPVLKSSSTILRLSLSRRKRNPFQFRWMTTMQTGIYYIRTPRYVTRRMTIVILVLDAVPIFVTSWTWPCLPLEWQVYRDSRKWRRRRRERGKKFDDQSVSSRLDPDGWLHFFLKPFDNYL